MTDVGIDYSICYAMHTHYAVFLGHRNGFTVEYLTGNSKLNGITNSNLNLKHIRPDSLVAI